MDKSSLLPCPARTGNHRPVTGAHGARINMITKLFAANLLDLSLAVVVGGGLAGYDLPPDICLGYGVLAWAGCVIAQLYLATVAGEP